MSVGLAVLAALTVAGLFLLRLLRVQGSWREGVRDELVAFVLLSRPGWKLVRTSPGRIELALPTGEEVTCNLGRVVLEAGSTPVGDLPARHAIFAAWLATLEQHLASLTLEPRRDRPRLRPRIVQASFARGEQAGEPPLPSVPLGVADLAVVFVLDGPGSVRYLSAAALEELGLDVAAALELARANLRPSLDRVVVRAVVEGGEARTLQSGDTYDAARLLLVGEHLAPGEELVAWIPDRDTLTLTPVAGVSRPARKAGAPRHGGDPLHAGAILLSAAGLRAAE